MANIQPRPTRHLPPVVINGNSVVLARIGQAGTPYAITVTPSIQPFVAEGYGATATGGYGQTVVVVTNTNPSGTGSLRDALGSGNRYITFAAGVNGDITLDPALFIGGSNITVDGTTCDGAGITIKGHTIWTGSANQPSGVGRDNIIFTGLRFQDQTDGADAYNEDGVTVKGGATNIVFDHCSFRGQQDGCVDISDNCTDITMQWCLFGLPQQHGGGGFLPSDIFRSWRVTYHHNLFTDIGSAFNGDGQYSRTPGFGDSSNHDAIVAGRLSGDVRCNVVWTPTNGYSCVQITASTRVNAVKNYFFGRNTSVGINYVVHTETNALAYASGNVNRRGGSVETSFPMSEIAPPANFLVAEENTAQLAAAAVLAGVGCRVGGLDAYDQNIIDTITAYLAANGGW